MFRQGLAQRLAMGGARFKALSPASKIALVFLVLVALVAVFAPVVATHDPLAAIARVHQVVISYSEQTAWVAIFSLVSFMVLRHHSLSV